MLVMDEMPTSLQLAKVAFDNGSFDKSAFTFASAAGPFSNDTLSAAISNGSTVGEIREYLSSYKLENVKQQLWSTENDKAYLPAFHAVSQNRLDVMELLFEYGADPNTKGATNMTLLKYTITCSHWNGNNVDAMVALLLSHGADPRCIPEELWTDYIKTSSTTGLMNNISNTKILAPPKIKDAWEKQLFHYAMVKSLNLTIRYLLCKASHLKPPTKRQMQLANLLGCPRLLRVPYYLVGQDHALQLVMNKVMAYDAYERNRPLVLAFAGVFGHGKTELAT